MFTRRPLLIAVITVFAVISVNVASAMAVATEGHWVINGASVTSTETVSSTLSGTATLSWSIFGVKVDVLCTASTLVDGTLNIGGNSTFGAFKFTGCTVSSPVGCKVTKGEIGVFPTDGQITLFLTSEEEAKAEKGRYALYTPLNAESRFATVAIEGCASEASYNITGSAGCEVSEEEAVLQECLLTSKALTLKIGSAAVSLQGHFLTALTGVHKGKTWSAKEV